MNRPSSHGVYTLINRIIRQNNGKCVTYHEKVIEMDFFFSSSFDNISLFKNRYQYMSDLRFQRTRRPRTILKTETRCLVSGVVLRVISIL